MAGTWPFATIDFHTARVAQVLARRLGEAMREQRLSAKRLAAKSSVNRQTVANVLAGSVWADLITMANLEAAVGVQLFPAFDDEDVVNPAPTPAGPSPAPTASSSPAAVGACGPSEELLAELQELLFGHDFTAAPWRVWLDVEQPDPDPGGWAGEVPSISDQRRLLENIPFRHPHGVLTSLRLLAEEAGWDMRETILALCEAQEAGKITWDQRTQSVAVCRAASR